MEEFEYEYPRRVRFRLGLSWIDATAEALHRMYPHVSRATIIESAWHRFIRTRLLPVLPSFVQRAARWVWPRYSLPASVVIKKLRGPYVDDREIVHKDEDFQNEINMYRKLRDLQGTTIPRYYGEARCDRRRALILSPVPGTTIYDQEAEKTARLTPDEFEARLWVAVGALAQHGLSYGDLNLANILFVGSERRVVFVDLEAVEVMEPKDIDYATDCTVREYVSRYKSFLRNEEQFGPLR